jgi:hypothetical protein
MSQTRDEAAYSTCAIAVDSVLSEIPTVWGRLECLAWLRYHKDDAHNRYALSGSRVSNESLSVVLKERHQELFYQWLQLNLRQQYRDLFEYSLQHSLDAGDLAQLIDSTLQNIVIPDHVPDPARELYWTDLKIVLGLLSTALQRST